ncbi:nuclear transport factor 2 family protein [Phycicoccus ginsengisoli]
MRSSPGASGDPAVVGAIEQTVRDYYEGWFDQDPERMRRALHPDLVKRSVTEPTGAVETLGCADMVEATAQGAGTRHPPDRRWIRISVNHVHGGIADVHVVGDVYVDYLHLARCEGRWRIVNALWAPADSDSDSDSDSDPDPDARPVSRAPE